MTYELSVIIPVYNVEKYIKECLDSVVCQTIGIENIEVIIVNDKTPDSSMSIVEEYANKYPSFKIINNEHNLGLGESRNIGLKYVTSDYVTFIDSDDFISPDAYENAISKIKQYDCDLLIYNWESFDGNRSFKEDSIHNQNTCEDYLVDDLEKHPELFFLTSAWNKIYHKSLFKYLNYSQGYYEDNCVTISVLVNAKKIFFTKGSIYYYRKNIDSITENISTEKLIDLSNVIKELFNLTQDFPLYSKHITFLIIKFINDILFWLHEYEWRFVDEKNIINTLKSSIIPIKEDYLDEFQKKYLDIPLYKDAILDLPRLDSETFLAIHKYLAEIMDLNAKASLYIDTGNGFNENDKITIDYEPDSINNLEFDLSGFSNVEALRFDPIEGYFIKCKILNVPAKYSNSINPVDDNYQIFSKLDPFYLLSSNVYEHFEISFKMDLLRNDEIEKMLDELGKKTHYAEASLYVDTGNGFNQDERIGVPYDPVNVDTLTFDLSSFSNVQALRFDPIEGYFIKCRIHNIEMVDSNCDNSLDDEFQQFSNTDPFYILGDCDCKKLDISFDLKLLTNEELNMLISKR